MALFRRRGPRGPKVPDADRTLGLCVGVRARQIFDPKTGECIFDELREIEEANIRAKRPPIRFFEEDGTETTDPEAFRLWNLKQKMER